MRVIFQVVTDVSAQTYLVTGVSGLLEMTGIAVRGTHLWRIMNRGESRVGSHESEGSITTDETVASAVERFAETMPFLSKNREEVSRPTIA